MHSSWLASLFLEITARRFSSITALLDPALFAFQAQDRHIVACILFAFLLRANRGSHTLNSMIGSASIGANTEI